MPGKKKILVVDDEPDILMVLKARLEGNGYEVVTALNGEAGLHAARAEDPDLIVLDVMMPVMDGFEFFKIIKQEPAYSNIPILMLTARGAMKDTFNALDADGFMSKPFDSKELVEKIAFLLAKRSLIVGDNPFMVEKCTKALQKYNYHTKVVGSPAEMLEEGRHNKYSVVVAHLASVVSKPEAFLADVRSMKYKTADLIIYCDSTVKGTEDNYTVAIDEMRNHWKAIGVTSFYDRRITGAAFTELLKDWISPRHRESS
jgi:two-component system, OmpR family, alkaline phosphatase synthesis response regulator PhoP